MSPIPPYTPGGGGSGPTTPSFDVEYDPDTNELVFTGQDFTSIAQIHVYGHSDSDPNSYFTFGPEFNGWNLVSANELRIPRAYEYFFTYNEGHAATLVYGEAWTAEATSPTYIAVGFTPVIVDQLISADPIDVTFEEIGNTVTAQGQLPVDFTDVTTINFYSQEDGVFQIDGNSYFILDPQTIQVLDVSSIDDHIFQAVEFCDVDLHVLYTWIGTLVVPG